jgi:hypothetical protein
MKGNKKEIKRNAADKKLAFRLIKPVFKLLDNHIPRILFCVFYLVFVLTGHEKEGFHLISVLGLTNIKSQYGNKKTPRK